MVACRTLTRNQYCDFADFADLADLADLARFYLPDTQLEDGSRIKSRINHRRSLFHCTLVKQALILSRPIVNKSRRRLLSFVTCFGELVLASWFLSSAACIFQKI
jgi:hypothetical protein